MLQLWSAGSVSSSTEPPMLRQIMLAPAIVVLAACAPKGPQPGQASADSTAAVVTDSAMVADSGGLAPSTDSTASKSTGAAPRGGQYIGRDSAFGPTFTVDSTGKVTPIAPAKKKP